MTEFWGIIDENVLRTQADVEVALERVSARLAPLPTYDLLNFVDGLHEALFRLDRRQFAEIQVFVRDLVIPQSEDGFQYARCACVLAGRRVFEEVLATGEGFELFTVPEVQAEGLLYLAGEHYEAKTGFRMEHRRTFPIDMMSNPDGWDRQQDERRTRANWFSRVVLRRAGRSRPGVPSPGQRPGRVVLRVVPG